VSVQPPLGTVTFLFTDIEDSTRLWESTPAEMTTAVKYCHDHEDVEQVARNMAELGVRRLPVVDREKRLVGIVALSNIAQSGDSKAADSLLEGVAQPH